MATVPEGTALEWFLDYADANEEQSRTAGAVRPTHEVMTHLFWSGKGYLVAVFVFGFSLIANLISNSVTGSGAYFDGHEWPVATSFIVSGLACWYAGRFFPKRTRLLLDPETGEQVVLRETHTLFFVPLSWWGPILAAGGATMLGFELLQ